MAYTVLGVGFAIILICIVLIISSVLCCIGFGTKHPRRWHIGAISLSVVICGYLLISPKSSGVPSVGPRDNWAPYRQVMLIIAVSGAVFAVLYYLYLWLSTSYQIVQEEERRKT